jgi:hypothetical protein
MVILKRFGRIVISSGDKRRESFQRGPVGSANPMSASSSHHYMQGEFRDMILLRLEEKKYQSRRRL